MRVRKYVCEFVLGHTDIHAWFASLGVRVLIVGLLIYMKWVRVLVFRHSHGHSH